MVLPFCSCCCVCACVSCVGCSAAGGGAGSGCGGGTQRVVQLHLPVCDLLANPLVVSTCCSRGNTPRLASQVSMHRGYSWTEVGPHAMPKDTH
ncbi:hypothetical protein EYF80_039810 [Liparis tanakae]|uniref:Secreted protein n=1 Tax=Liparis tanakae TaxID=230148 RepID=A0A4Z2GBJ9_9TELE|nr:hypothetical protein EYF80_039810 [Liparis tanakae]